jgi:hypothetical protein
MALTRLNNRAIPDGAVTSGKLANASIVASKLASQGSILQTVEVVNSAQYESTTSSWVTVMSANITPSSTSSRILVFYFTAELVTRGSTKLLIGVFKNNNLLHRSTDYIGQGFGGNQAAGAGTVTGVTDMFFDSPNTTSQVSYQVKYRGDSTSASVGVNHTRGNEGDGIYEQGRLILFAMI